MRSALARLADGPTADGPIPGAGRRPAERAVASQVPGVKVRSVGTDIACGDANGRHGGVGGIGTKHSRVHAGPEVLHHGPVKNSAGEDGGDAGRVWREHFGADPADRLYGGHLLDLTEEGVAWQRRLPETQFTRVRNTDVRSGRKLVGVRNEIPRLVKEACDLRTHTVSPRQSAGHQLLRPLQDPPRRGAVVQAGHRQHVRVEDRVSQDRPNSGISSTANRGRVPLRVEAGPVPARITRGRRPASTLPPSALDPVQVSRCHSCAVCRTGQFWHIHVSYLTFRSIHDMP